MSTGKETCDCCHKSINIGQSISECGSCSLAIHTRCFRKSNFEYINDKSYCGSCANLTEVLYDPFPDQAVAIDDSDYDKFYNDPSEIMHEDVSRAKNVLASCKKFDLIKDFNRFVSQHDPNTAGNSQKLSTLFLNLDGNASNFDLLSLKLSQITYKFSIIGLAETNTDASNKDLYSLEGYSSVYQSTIPGKSKGTGVALYISDDLSYTVAHDISRCTTDLESLFVRVPIDKNSIITIGVVYRPPSGDSEKGICELKSIIESNPSSGNLQIFGDFNIDLLKSHESLTNKFEDATIGLGLFPVISLATHCKPKCRKSCIDNILTNRVDSVVSSGVIRDSTSHHSFIFQISNIDLAGQSAGEKCDDLLYYDFSNKKIKSFIDDLGNDISVNKYEHENWNIFLDYFNCKIDHHFKLAKPKQSKRTRENNPWISESLIDCIDKKYSLYDDWIKSKQKASEFYPEGNKLLYNKFKNYRKTLKHAITQAKSIYYSNKINKHSGDMKKTWSVINEVRGKRQKKLKPKFVINNEVIVNRRHIVNSFNNYFVSLAPKLNNSSSLGEVLTSPLPSYHDYLKNSTVSSFFLEESSLDEIDGIIQDLQSGKASDIPVKIIKHSSSILSPILSKLINKGMEDGVFPDELKIGRITPIYKKENPELLENYRPVSTLPIFGKIFEKVVYKRLYNYFSSKGLMYGNQYGFRKDHSTSHALNYSIDLVKSAIDKGNHVIGIFIDLSKAFDTIDHKIMTSKLQHYGIRGQPLKLLTSYLSNRTQYVSTLNEKSDLADVIYGVPQGSVLGPLLFLIYVNDLPNCHSMTQFILFADDTNIFVIGKDRNECTDKANRLLKDVYHYMKANKLHINAKKSCFMHFQPKNSTSNELSSPIFINKTEIDEVSCTKFLGVTIDNKLCWEPHINILIKKLRSAIGSICRVSKFLPKNLQKTLYQTLFESHLSYGITVWGNAAKKFTSKLFIIQKHCIRVLLGDKESYLAKFETCMRVRQFGKQKLGPEFYIRESSKPLFNKNHILSIHNLYTSRTLLEIFKVLKSRNPYPIYQNLHLSTRKSTLLVLPKLTTTHSYQASILWNKLRNQLSPADKEDFSSPLGKIKNIIRSLLAAKQNLGDSSRWDDLNFEF